MRQCRRKFAYGIPIRAPHFAGFALLIAGMYLLGR
jgi:hypothetical protein